MTHLGDDECDCPSCSGVCPHSNNPVEIHGLGQCFLLDDCPCCDSMPRLTRDEEREAMADERWHNDREEGRA